MAKKPEKRMIKGVGECLVLPTAFIEKIMEVIIKQGDDPIYRHTKLIPFQEEVIRRGIELKGDEFYCCITAKELKGLNRKFEDAQEKARMVI